MIGTEVAVFAALFGAGLGAGLLAAFLLALGGGSRVARAVCDLVTPPVVGVLFFLTLRAVAKGVFRLYSVVAFLFGVALAILLARRSAPLLSRVLNRVKVPIKSLENRISLRLARLFAPIAQRRAARKKKRVEKRTCALNEERKEKERKAREKHLAEMAKTDRILVRRPEGGRRRHRTRPRKRSQAIDIARQTR